MRTLLILTVIGQLIVGIVLGLQGFSAMSHGLVQTMRALDFTER